MRLSLVFLTLLAFGCGDNSPMMSTDMSMTIQDGGPGGTKMFGDQCMVAGSPGDCAPGLICDMFAMGTVFRCTRMCDVNPNPTNCPAPSNGTCNGKGECKFTM
jgi:hypothetical protein